MAIQLKEIPADEQKALKVPPLKEHEAKFPKKTFGSAAESKQALKAWQKDQPEPEAKKNPNVGIKAVPPSASNVGKLVAIANSDAAPSELVKQKVDEEQFFGILFSGLTTWEFLRMEGEYKKRKSDKKTAATADRDWAKVVQAFQEAFATAGMKVSAEQLSQYAKDLAGNKTNLETFTRIANSRVVKKDQQGLGVTRGGTLVGAFETTVATIIDPNLTAIVIPNLCSQPFAQGTFTRHWSHSWNFSVSLPYPCPTWTNPFRICWSTISVATVSVDVGLNVGYRVTCCGAIVWGLAYASACGTLLGITKCVSCTGRVNGVAGFGRTPVGSQCSYGIGVNASIQCQVFGATVFNAGWSFGFNVTGPCPPPGLC